VNRANAGALVLLGIVLLANGAWLYQGGVAHESVAVYKTRETREPWGDEVADCDCYSLQSRDCAVAN
jgi:hypothetical protein